MQDTIVAIATPIGYSGVGVVRLSGPKALSISRKLWKSDVQKLNPRLLYLGWLKQGQQTVDQAMLVVMPAPHSYTGEDVVEIQTHGSPAVLDWLLTHAVKNGARLAEPGEFTKRAYLNKKIDLTQAEAVNDLIHAQSISAVRAASDQLAGGLSEKITTIRTQLIALSAAEAAYLDFGDEDIPPRPVGEVRKQLKEIKKVVDELIRSQQQTAVLREGVRVAIIGLPNAGKSTLLNTLLNYERSIVTNIAGTTRDAIEETVLIDDIPMRLTDTAGLNTDPDQVEQIGIERATQIARNADILLVLIAPGKLAATKAFLDSKNLQDVMVPKRTIIVATKSDLASYQPIKWGKHTSIAVSARTKKGITSLRRSLSALAKNEVNNESALVSTQRHLALLVNAQKALLSAEHTLTKNLSRDTLLVEIDAAIDYLNELAGDNVSQSKLDEMFSNFCIGK